MRPTLPLLCLAVTMSGTAVAGPRTDEAAVRALIDASNTARRSFDQAALAALLAPGYVEISPIGEVDPRDRTLGFYAADRKTPVPTIVTDERTVQVIGNMALARERQSFGERAVRVVYVAQRMGRDWRLVSAQFTPIRSPRPS